MTTRAANTRDAGVALVSRINRWMIAGAIGLSGVISLVAAHAFHGHSVNSSGSSAITQSSSLQQPSQAPSSTSPGSGGVVSGGS